MEEDTIQTEEQLIDVAQQEAAPAPTVQLPATPLFGRFEADGVVVRDPGLARYVNLELVGLPHSSARHGNKRFAKRKVNVVERFINDIMRTQSYQGKKSKAYQVVEDAFSRVAERTKDNPIQVFVKALENSAPREEVTRLRYGGINVPKSVDVSPQRRLDIALRNLAKGGTSGSFKSKKPIANCVADEILKAASNDPSSFAVGKKDEVERVAKSAR